MGKAAAAAVGAVAVIAGVVIGKMLDQAAERRRVAREAADRRASELRAALASFLEHGVALWEEAVRVFFTHWREVPPNEAQSERIAQMRDVSTPVLRYEAAAITVAIFGGPALGDAARSAVEAAREVQRLATERLEHRMGIEEEVLEAAMAA